MTLVSSEEVSDSFSYQYMVSIWERVPVLCPCMEGRETVESDRKYIVECSVVYHLVLSST